MLVSANVTLYGSMIHVIPHTDYTLYIWHMTLTTVHEGVSALISAKPPDILKAASGHFPLVLVAGKVDVFDKTLGQFAAEKYVFFNETLWWFPALFVVTKVDTFAETLGQLAATNGVFLMRRCDDFSRVCGARTRWSFCGEKLTRPWTQCCHSIKPKT